MRNLSATLLLLLACVTDSTLSGSTSWKVVPAVVNKVRSILERLEKGGRGDEQTPLTKNGLQDLLRTIQNAAREGTAGGSSWYRCELDTVDAKDMTRALFQLHHARKATRITNAMNDWGAMEQWLSKEDFIQSEGGRLQMHNSGAVYISSFGGRYNDGSKLPGQRNVRQDLHNLFKPTGEDTPAPTSASAPASASASLSSNRTRIGFEVGSSESTERLRKSGMFKVPPFLEFTDKITGDGPPEKPVISVGPAKSGLSFHSHGEAWLGLVGGEKLWLIAKPSVLPAAEHGTGAAKTAWRWLVDGGMGRVPPGSVQVCVQRRGEIIYLPRWYMHATVNLGDTVGMGMQGDSLMQVAMNYTLPELKAKAAATPAYRQMYQTVLTKLHHELPNMAYDENIQDAATWLQMISTVFRNHVPTALTSATTLRQIADGVEDGLQNVAAGGKAASDIARQAAALRGTALSTVLELHHQLQRELWSRRMAAPEAAHTAELLGEFLESHLGEHAAAVTVLRTALAWEPTLMRARQNLASSYHALNDTATADKHFAVVFAIAGDVQTIASATSKLMRDNLHASMVRLIGAFGTRYCNLIKFDGSAIAGNGGGRFGGKDTDDECALAESSSPASCAQQMKVGKGTLRVAVLHSHNNDDADDERYTGNNRDHSGGGGAVQGCVPVLILKDDDGSHEAMWLDEFYLLEAGRGVAKTAPLPPSKKTIESNVYLPLHGKMLSDLI